MTIGLNDLDFSGQSEIASGKMNVRDFYTETNGLGLNGAKELSLRMLRDCVGDPYAKLVRGPINFKFVPIIRDRIAVTILRLKCRL